MAKRKPPVLSTSFSAAARAGTTSRTSHGSPGPLRSNTHASVTMARTFSPRLVMYWTLPTKRRGSARVSTMTSRAPAAISGAPPAPTNSSPPSSVLLTLPSTSTSAAPITPMHEATPPQHSAPSMLSIEVRRAAVATFSRLSKNGSAANVSMPANPVSIISSTSSPRSASSSLASRHAANA